MSQAGSTIFPAVSFFFLPISFIKPMLRSAGAGLRNRSVLPFRLKGWARSRCSWVVNVSFLGFVVSLLYGGERYEREQWNVVYSGYHCRSPQEEPSEWSLLRRVAFCSRLTPTFVSKRRSLPRTRWSTLSSYHLLLCTLPFCSMYFPLFSRLLLQTMSLATTRISLA